MKFKWVSKATELEADIFNLLFQKELKELMDLMSNRVGKSASYSEGLFELHSRETGFVEVDKDFSEKIKEFSKDENFVKLVKDGRGAQTEKWIMQGEDYPIEKIQPSIDREKENATKIAALLGLPYEYYESKT